MPYSHHHVYCLFCIYWKLVSSLVKVVCLVLFVLFICLYWLFVRWGLFLCNWGCSFCRWSRSDRDLCCRSRRTSGSPVLWRNPVFLAVCRICLMLGCDCMICGLMNWFSIVLWAVNTDLGFFVLDVQVGRMIICCGCRLGLELEVWHLISLVLIEIVNRTVI